MDTMQWGSDHKPSRWTSRLGVPARMMGPIATGVAVLGFALIVMSELLPWRELTLPASSTRLDELDELLPGRSSRLGQLAVFQLFPYYLVLAGLLVAVAVVVLGRSERRRMFAAAAAGLGAGYVVLLVSLHGSIKAGGEFTSAFIRPGLPEPSVGTGFYTAAAGVALLLAATVLANLPAAPAGGADADAPAGRAETNAETETNADADAAADTDVAADTDTDTTSGYARPNGPQDLTVAPAEPILPAQPTSRAG